MADLRDFIQRMRDTADIAQIIGEKVALQKKSGNNLFGLCPFHAEKTPSFSVNLAKKYYHCFGCGSHGDALNFIIQTEAGGDFITGVEMLANRLGMVVPRGGKNEYSDKIMAVLQRASEYFYQQLSQNTAAQAYLKRRGLSPETIEQFQIGSAPNSWDNIRKAVGADESLLLKSGLLRKNESGKIYDYFRHRIMFPIMESSRRVIGFGARALEDDEQAKYLNSPDIPQIFSKGATIFGLPQARAAASEKNRLIITEGYMDVVMLSQAGFNESVAAMGTALTPYQIKKIDRVADNLIFAFDGDNAGQKAAWRSVTNILPMLRDGVSVAFLFLPQGEDPDSFIRARGANAFEKTLAAAIPLGDYIVKHIWRDIPANADEGRVSAALAEGQKLARLLNVDKAPFIRELLLQRLSERSQISAAAINRAVARGDNKTAAGGSRSNAKFKMRSGGKIYHLLACLAVNPHLIETVEESLPLIGDNHDTEIAVLVLHYLRWQKEGEDTPDIIAYLKQEGYQYLARQIRDTARERYDAMDKDNLATEFGGLVHSLRQDYNKNKSTKDWLDKIRNRDSGDSSSVNVTDK